MRESEAKVVHNDIFLTSTPLVLVLFEDRGISEV
jgi:hypothetical protein